MGSVEIEGGWIVEIEGDKENYKITGIEAVFGHGVYLSIDKQNFSDEQWKMFHDRIAAVIGSEVR